MDDSMEATRKPLKFNSRCHGNEYSVTFRIRKLGPGKQLKVGDILEYDLELLQMKFQLQVIATFEDNCEFHLLLETFVPPPEVKLKRYVRCSFPNHRPVQRFLKSNGGSI